MCYHAGVELINGITGSRGHFVTVDLCTPVTVLCVTHASHG